MKSETKGQRKIQSAPCAHPFEGQSRPRNTKEALCLAWRAPSKEHTIFRLVRSSPCSQRAKEETVPSLPCLSLSATQSVSYLPLSFSPALLSSRREPSMMKIASFVSVLLSVPVAFSQHVVASSLRQKAAKGQVRRGFVSLALRCLASTCPALAWLEAPSIPRCVAVCRFLCSLLQPFFIPTDQLALSCWL